MPKKRLLYFSIAAIIIIALGFAGIAIFKNLARPPVAGPEFQKGLTYVAWTKEGYRNVNSVKSMEELIPLGVEWVCLVTTWYQDSVDSKKIYPLDNKTPSEDSLLFAVRKLHDLNFKIMLKPHLDIIESEGGWRGDIGFANRADWRAWFASYTDFILHYARLAQRENIEILCIGTELSNAALSQPALWRSLIRKIRRVYKGQLTYAANWHDEFNYVEFWDDLDYAAIDPYFPLPVSSKQNVEKLKEAWAEWLQVIQCWQESIDKPVIFAEIGYKSSEGANEQPWQHSPAGKVDLQLQADCYEALLSTFWDKPWFSGLYWWYWGVNPKMGGGFNRGFTPQNKPAQEVIKRWYKKTVPQKRHP